MNIQELDALVIGAGIGMFFVGMFAGWLLWGGGNPWRETYVCELERVNRRHHELSNDLAAALRRADDVKSVLREILELAQEELGE